MIVLGKLLGVPCEQRRQQYQRVFQPLALVNGHDRDCRAVGFQENFILLLFIAHPLGTLAFQETEGAGDRKAARADFIVEDFAQLKQVRQFALSEILL